MKKEKSKRIRKIITKRERKRMKVKKIIVREGETKRT